MTDEQWKVVEGFSDYEISNTGRLRSNKPGFPQRVLKGSLNTKGYWHYVMCQDGITKTITAHRLVATHFLENPEGLETINHKDFNKLNNAVENLEFLSNGDNLRHAHKGGRMAVDRRFKSSLEGRTNNRQYDPTYYTFWHPEHGTFTGTKLEFRKKYLKKSDTSNFFRFMAGTQRKVSGWQHGEAPPVVTTKKRKNAKPK